MEEKIKVTWSFSALEMLAEIHEYISERSEHSADNYIDGIYESTKKIERHPESCAPCKNPKLREGGYRCCLYKNHIIVYEYINEEIEILAVIHSKRNPSSLNLL